VANQARDWRVYAAAHRLRHFAPRRASRRTGSAPAAFMGGIKSPRDQPRAIKDPIKKLTHVRGGAKI
jgi:hypothetical protein